MAVALRNVPSPRAVPRPELYRSRGQYSMFAKMLAPGASGAEIARPADSESAGPRGSDSLWTQSGVTVCLDVAETSFVV